VQIDFELTDDEFKGASPFGKLVSWRRWLTSFFRAVLVLSLFACLVRFKSLTFSLFFEIIFGIFIALLPLYVIFTGIFLLVRRRQRELRGRKIVLTEDGVHVGEGTSSMFIRWEAFTKLERHDNYFVVSVGKEDGVIIPHRVFSSEDERDKFLAKLGYL